MRPSVTVVPADSGTTRSVFLTASSRRVVIGEAPLSHYNSIHADPPSYHPGPARVSVSLAGDRRAEAPGAGVARAVPGCGRPPAGRGGVVRLRVAAPRVR